MYSLDLQIRGAAGSAAISEKSRQLTLSQVQEDYNRTAARENETVNAALAELQQAQVSRIQVNQISASRIQVSRISRSRILGKRVRISPALIRWLPVRQRRGFLLFYNYLIRCRHLGSL